MQRTLSEVKPLVRWAKTPALLAVCYAILLTAVLLGLTTSGVGSLPHLASPAELGLGSNRVGIEPLTDRFIDRALGPVAASSDLEPNRAGSPGEDGLGSPDDTGGQDVDHPFTNDDQASAYEVTRLPFTGRTSTTEADRQPGEPECGRQLGGTVWYRYTATRSETLLADTFETGYTTSLAAYQQRPNGEGLLVACHVESQGYSQIRIDVSSEATYLFQIGAAVQGGALAFHLKRFGGTILASVSTAGAPGNDHSDQPSVSFDGRYVAFQSAASNLHPRKVAPCTYTGRDGLPGLPCSHVFLRDRQAGTTSLVSVGLDGRSGNGSSGAAQVSDDGRYVVFYSHASDLVAGDRNDLRDIFLRDMRTGRTELISVSSEGEHARPGHLDPSPAQRGSWQSSLSADGRYVAFDSTSPNLVEGDNDDSRDTFVRDRRNGMTRMVSLDNEGKPSPTDANLDSISRNGRWIVFVTDFPMSENDLDLTQDVFVRDLWTGTTELVSVPEAGHELEGVREAAASSWLSNQRSISDDGRFVVFGHAGALVDRDTNRVLDVFVRDRLMGTTERVSVSSSGGEGESIYPGSSPLPPTLVSSEGAWAISGDGRTVAFASTLNLLEPGDENNVSDVFVHDRTSGETLRISGSGNNSGGRSPRISGDGLNTTFISSARLSYRDTTAFEDVYVFSPLAAPEQARLVKKASVPTSPCGANSEYANVGMAGAHEEVKPPAIPSFPYDMLFDPLSYGAYQEHSVVRFKYRIDASGSPTKRFAQSADVRIGLRWDNTTDYDLYVYDPEGRLLASSITDNNFNVGETVLIRQVLHCTDLQVDVVNSLGRPTDAMTLDTLLGGRE